MLEEVPVGEHSSEYAPGRVGMLELVGVKSSNRQRGYPCQKEASDGDQREVDGIVGLAHRVFGGLVFG
jgi:hypothetical protein